MKMIFKAFCKKFFGAKYERLIRTLFLYLLVFWGFHIADLKIEIAPFILYLMITAFTAGVMWQTLSSQDNAAYMQNLMMLPFERREFVLSYVAAISAYTLLTKTAALMTVLLAVSVWSGTEILTGFLCAANAVLTAAVIFSLKKYWYIGSFWIAALLAALVCFWNKPWFALLTAANIILAFVLLLRADEYSFYPVNHKNKRSVKVHRHYSVWRYFFRYLSAHKNYLINTAIMYCAACVLPLFWGQMESRFIVPIGFAILSLNTPICILLSCDHDLEQAMRFLPCQAKTFCVPYCLFIFSCNIIADIIFLCSLQIQIGGVTAPMIVAAIFFALQSAVCSVLLEWFHPLREWKTESDLWHHPRKYLVPAAMLLLAGAVSAMPVFAFALIFLLIAEITVLLIYCWRSH